MALADNLIAYWPLDEASGDALDAHGSNDLTETGGTIGATTGLVNGCRDFEAGDTELFLISDNTDLSTGDIDFTIAFWVNLESTGTQVMLSKDSGANPGREFAFNLVSAVPRLVVSPDGNNVDNLDATTFGALSTGTWYFIAGGHSATLNEVFISVNGTKDTTSHTTGVFDSATGFALGARSAGTFPLDGLLDEVGFWKRVLTDDEIDELYNSGAGRDYAYITGGGGGGLSIPIASYHYRHHLRAAC